jgi:hypothetical protein
MEGLSEVPVRLGGRSRAWLVWLSCLLFEAEADGNRTRLAGLPGHVGFEDRGDHQEP